MASSTRLRSPGDSAAKGTTVPGSSSGWSRGNKGRMVGISSGFTGSSSSQTLWGIATSVRFVRRRSIGRRREEVQGEELEQQLQQLAEAPCLDQGLLFGGGQRRGLSHDPDELMRAHRLQRRGIAARLELAEPQQGGLEALQIPARQILLDGQQVPLELLIDDGGSRQIVAPGQLLAHAEAD